MAKRFPAMATYKGYNGGAAKGSLLHNDDSIFGRMNRPDQNRGGGPSGRSAGAGSGKTGAGGGQNGRDPAPSTSLSGRSGSGNPGASAGMRGGVGGSLGASSEGRQSFSPEARISGHGGSPQHREREIPGDFHKRGGVGAHGQEFVPGGRKSDTSRMGGGVTTAGNTGGLAQKRIAGRFKRGAMGARATGAESRGSYGSRPVTANT